MKKVFSIIAFLATIFTLSSCDFFSEKQSGQDAVDSDTIVGGVSKEIKEKIAAQDTLMNALVQQVDTLAQALSQVKKENAEQKDQIADLKSPKSTWGYISFGAFILGLISLIISILKPKGISKKRVYDIFEECLDKSCRIHELQETVKKILSSLPNNRKSHTSSSSYAPSLEGRLGQLEYQINEVIKKITNPATQPVSSRHDSTRSGDEHEYQKIGYAKVDTDKYFTTIFDVNQEGCVFKLTFTSPTKGNFNIIALDKIQSRNDWQKKVECSGVSIKDASSFQIEEEGICEKIDENTWKVTKPLKIKLIK